MYNYIILGLLDIKNYDLPLKLRRSTKKPVIKKNKKLLGTSISERPEIINDRTEFGHWEIDTVLGLKSKSDSVLLTMTERKTRAEIIKVISSKTALAVQEALNEIIHEIGKDNFKQIFKSITSDNGSEFASLSTLEEESSTKIYFCHPYTSCERGTNERQNRLIRRFIPKGTPINNYTLHQVQKIQQWCNSLPRKMLGYKTPLELFKQEIELLSL